MQEAFRELMARHRNLKFVSVDSAKLETNLEKKLGLKPFDGSHQLVHFTRYNVTGKAKVGSRSRALLLEGRSGELGGGLWWRRAASLSPVNFGNRCTFYIAHG